jgi:hypothetical protein
MIITLAGRLIDSANADESRFPLENAGLVRERILELFRAEAATILVSSAACGADLLALDAARELKMRRYVVLPFDRERFRQTSVTSRAGDWENLYDEICDEAERDGNLIVLEDFEDENEAYSAATEEILSRAESLQTPSEQVLAVFIWEGRAKDFEKDETNAFAERARALGFPVKEILTK